MPFAEIYHAIDFRDHRYAVYLHSLPGAPVFVLYSGPRRRTTILLVLTEHVVHRGHPKRFLEILRVTATERSYKVRLVGKVKRAAAPEIKS